MGSVTGRACLAIATLATLATCGACTRDKRRAVEETGGSWRPILLAAPDVIRCPPPPAPGSAQDKAELAELHALQARWSTEAMQSARYWDAGASLRWNEITRGLVAKHRETHGMASRAYALVSVAQYDALVAARNNKQLYRRPQPVRRSDAIKAVLPLPDDFAYPSEHAAVAAASAAVLTYLFPDEARVLDLRARENEAARLLGGGTARSDLEAGDALGRAVAEVVIARARNDGAEDGGGNPVVDGRRWFPSPSAPLADPRFGEVRPWLMRAPDQFRVGPPPEPDSPQFQAALAEVRHISDTRTQHQKYLAALWADGAGSYAPAGRWNQIAGELIVRHQLNELRAARAFALLNMALMDAGVAAWDTKYRYFFPRPSQVDPAITTPVGEPNSPSYTCSHAAFSSAGAVVLGYLFPGAREALDQRATDAIMSRVYGGIQFRFEGEAGARQGRGVAELAIARGRADGSPAPAPSLPGRLAVGAEDP